MTDADLIKRARQLQRLMWKMHAIVDEIRESDHPNAEKAWDSLKDECVPYAWPEHVIHHALEHSERWETGNWGIRYKRGNTRHIEH